MPRRQVVCNNLGGHGPGDSEPPELRFRRAGLVENTPVDVVPWIGGVAVKEILGLRESSGFSKLRPFYERVELFFVLGLGSLHNTRRGSLS